MTMMSHDNRKLTVLIAGERLNRVLIAYYFVERVLQMVTMKLTAQWISLFSAKVAEGRGH